MNTYKIDEFSKLLTEDFLNDGLDAELSRANRFKRKLSLLLVEIEILSPEYKSDKYSFFRHLSCMVRNLIRTVDFAVRLGSRILIVLPETERSGAENVLSKLNEKVKTFNFSDTPDTKSATGIEVELKGSIVTFPEDADKKDKLLEKLNSELKVIT